MVTPYQHLLPLWTGGFIIVDDYSDWESCRAAIDEYRMQHNISSPKVLVPHLAGEEARGTW